MPIDEVKPGEAQVGVVVPPQGPNAPHSPVPAVPQPKVEPTRKDIIAAEVNGWWNDNIRGSVVGSNTVIWSYMMDAKDQLVKRLQAAVG